jgi:hypothetical protein
MKLTKTDQDILDMHQRLTAVNAFVTALDVPGDIAPAFMTGRPELIKLAHPRVLSADECAVMFKLVRGLLETNQALRDHAALVLKLSETQHQAARGMVQAMNRLRIVAGFQNPEMEGGDE